MDLSYREKRTWINLITQLVIYGIYYIQLLRNRLSATDLLSSVIALIVIQIVLLSALAIAARRDSGLNLKDERDLLIERSAYRNAYFTLVGLLIAVMALTILHAFDPGMRSFFHPGPFSLVNVLIFLLMLAEFAKLFSQPVLGRQTA